MRVALVGNLPPPFGGVSVHVAALASALREAGADVRVVDLARVRDASPWATPARGALRYARALAAAAAERRLVHVHTSGANPRSWLVALGAAGARLPGAPAPVVTFHSGLAATYLEGAADRRRLARRICGGFGAVVAVSRELAAALEGCGVAPARITVLPAFLGSGLTPGAPPRRLAALRHACSPVFCAAVAPTPTYGEDVLLGAFARVRALAPRAGLVVFGPRSDRGAAAAVGLRGGVLALGELDHAAALGVIAACDVFVRPTRADGDALSVREALSLGRPVVASDVARRPAGCALFPAGDAERLADRLLDAARSRPAPIGGLVPVRAPLETLLDLYRAVGAGRPMASDSAALAEAPCSSP